MLGSHLSASLALARDHSPSELAHYLLGVDANIFLVEVLHHNVLMFGIKFFEVEF